MKVGVGKEGRTNGCKPCKEKIGAHLKKRKKGADALNTRKDRGKTANLDSAGSGDGEILVC